MKSTDNLSPRGMLAWKVLRFFVPPKPRWYFEGHPKLRGQLWYEERKFLYQTIRASNPLHCFEIGTWRGGGSTLFISQALKDNGQGTLHTVEVDNEFYNDAVRNYRTYLPNLADHVTFHLGNYRIIYTGVLQEAKSVDFLILDGAENGQETLDQYNFFLPYMRKGTLLMVHDWYTEKTRLLKPILENGAEWEIKAILNPPDSVGLALAVRTR